MVITNSAFYLSMFNGERVKLWLNASVAWAVDYGDYGLSMVMSPNEDYLLTGTSPSLLAKISPLNGTVLSAVKTSTSSGYEYIDFALNTILNRALVIDI